MLNIDVERIIMYIIFLLQIKYLMQLH